MSESRTYPLALMTRVVRLATDESGQPSCFVVAVECPYGCGTHWHSAALEWSLFDGLRRPHCEDGIKRSSYMLTDPNGCRSDEASRPVRAYRKAVSR